MKRFFLLIFVLLLSLPLMAQDPVPPENWGDVLINSKEWFASFGGIVLLTAFIAAFLNGLLKITGKFYKQVIAWSVAIILLVGSDLINLGYAAQFPILLALIHGLAAGLASNGIFDIPWLKYLLDKIEGLFKNG